MKIKIIPSLATIGFLVLAPISSQAIIMTVSGPNSTAGTAAAIIAAPGSVTNATVTNTGQQGFNEKQGVLLGSALAIDLGGSIASGTRVDSHMIFLNNPSSSGSIFHNGVQWTFSGAILGVMSDSSGNLEAASTSILGNLATTYPGSGFTARGMEGNDSYAIAGNVLTVNMGVSQPGDWIRVVTKSSSVPDAGSTILLLGAGLLGLASVRRWIKRN